MDTKAATTRIERIRRRKPLPRARRTALLRLLGNNAAVVDQLELLVAIYLNTPRGQLSREVASTRKRVMADVAKLNELAKASGDAQAAVDRVYETLRTLKAESESAWQSLGFFIAGTVELAAIQNGIAKLARPRDLSMLLRLQAAARSAQDDCRGSWGRAGKPADADRHNLENSTARALLDGGFELKESRTGILAKTLEEIYQAAGIDYPHDLMDVLKRIVTASTEPNGLIPIQP